MLRNIVVLISTYIFIFLLNTIVSYFFVFTLYINIDAT